MPSLSASVKVTARVAALLMAKPWLLDTMTEYSPASLDHRSPRVRTVPVAPSIGLPFLRHWQVLPTPEASTLKLASVPCSRVRLAGWVMMIGVLSG